MRHHGDSKGTIIMMATSLVLLLLLASPALATDRYVATGGNDALNDCSGSASPCATIAHAVDESTDGDTVHLAAGTYNEANIEISIDLTIVGNDRSDTIIDADTDSDGQGNDRHIKTDNGGDTITLSKITFRNGYPSDNGGSIYCVGQTLNIDDCAFTGNDANTSDGGVIWSDCNATITNSSFTDNEAGEGGAIFIDSETVTINNCTISGNSANSGSGGGIHSDPGNFDNLTITDTVIANNEASNNGGGINVRGETIVRRSTISGNKALKYGGGVSVENNKWLHLINSTVSDNSAVKSGGGLSISIPANGSGNANLHNVTVTNNTADKNSATTFHGGGIFFNDATGPSTLNLENSIVAGNYLAAAYNDCYKDGATATLSSGGYNLIGVSEGGSCDAAFTSAGDLLNAIASELIDATLADNGGPTKTHALLSDSAAIDAGMPEGDGSCQDHEATKLDQDQRGFIKPVGGRCDIGAYEKGSCGDGAIDPGEECDDGTNNSDTTADSCRMTCILRTCGDGVVDSGEECDGGDNCNADCTSIAAAPGASGGTSDEDDGADASDASAGGGCSLSPVESTAGVSLLTLLGSALGAIVVGLRKAKKRS
jgi:Chlamydia polymorphic membrane protein (Chlamydia_PMP) repeat